MPTPYEDIEKYSKLRTLEGYLKAYDVSQPLKDHDYVKRACAFNLGAMYISQQSFREGLDFLTKALPPEGKKDGKSHGDLHFNFGLAHEGLKERSEAKRYFKMALEEYKSELTNIQREAATVQKIVCIHLEEQEFSEADKCLTELIDLFSKLGEFDREMQAKVDRASLLLSMKDPTTAQNMADACLETLKDTKSSTSNAKHFTDLAVIYTQLVSYDKAIEASRRALDILEDQNDLNGSNTKLLSVLYQNLGAVYNFKGEYYLSIEYHRKATEGFAKYNERLFQGHCFTNMGYAYSQLNNMEKAKEFFLHGLQAAREKDDFKSQWQNLEALACVAFRDKNPAQAEEYLQEALAVFFPKPKGSDPDPDWIRLNKKYRDSIVYQIQEKNTENSSLSKKQLGEGREGDLYTDSDKGDVKVVRRGSKTRYLKVRRSGTLRRFTKVALGLDPSTSIKERDEESRSGTGEESSEHSREGSENEKEDKSDESDEGDKVDRLEREQTAVNGLSKRPASSRPPDSYIPRSVTAQAVVSDIESGASEQLEVEEGDSNDSDEDSKKVKANMRQYLSRENETETPTQREVQADVHAQAGQSSDDSSEESSDEESVPERPHKPPLPSLSPQPTDQNLRTYETIGGISKEPDKHFFHQKPPRVPKDGSQSGQPLEDVAGSSGTYASIRHTSKPGTPQERVKDSDGNEVVSEEETEKMSRAERDVLLYDQFKQDMEDRKNDAEDDTQEETSMGDQKKSKSCILM